MKQLEHTVDSFFLFSGFTDPNNGNHTGPAGPHVLLEQIMCTADHLAFSPQHPRQQVEAAPEQA